MDWALIEDLYLALSRVFDRFITFIINIFGEDEE